MAFHKGETQCTYNCSCFVRSTEINSERGIVSKHGLGMSINGSFNTLNVAKIMIVLFPLTVIQFSNITKVL